MQTILNTTKLTEIYILCDDFIKALDLYMEQHFLEEDSYRSPKKDRMMSRSEMMSIVIFYHYSGFRCFKWYYTHVIKIILKSYFPESYSYNRFVYLMSELTDIFPLFITIFGLSTITEANYIDSKKIVVCHNRRIKSNQVFKNIAKRGKSSTGWFYGFKLHLIINQLGELVFFEITPGNVADNNHDLLRKIADKINGFVYGDRGYLSKIREELKGNGLIIIPRLRNNMKKEKRTAKQKYYLRKRGLIETVFDFLKHLFDIEHSRYRSPRNCILNILAALTAYAFLDRKPSIQPYNPKMEIAIDDILIV
ncbi:MAG: IS982 family transposase [Nitrososphaeraceae archaeon]|nr:IS982 family transposase [Nitrososphaeraceae archaeon]